MMNDDFSRLILGFLSIGHFTFVVTYRSYIAGRLDFIKEDRGAKERAQSYPTCITSCRPTNKENKDKGSAYRNTGQ